MFEISCTELGITDCDFHVEGDTPAAVIEQVRDHLREHYDMDLPKTDDILDGEYKLDDIEEDERLVIRRLRQKLGITPAEAPVPPRIIPPLIPPTGNAPGRSGSIY